MTRLSVTIIKSSALLSPLHATTGGSCRNLFRFFRLARQLSIFLFSITSVRAASSGDLRRRRSSAGSEIQLNIGTSRRFLFSVRRSPAIACVPRSSATAFIVRGATRLIYQLISLIIATLRIIGFRFLLLRRLVSSRRFAPIRARLLLYTNGTKRNETKRNESRVGRFRVLRPPRSKMTNLVGAD